MAKKRVLVILLAPALLLLLMTGGFLAQRALSFAQGPRPLGSGPVQQGQPNAPAGAGVSAPLGPQAALGDGFTYQGWLRDGSGSPITSTCDVTFRLWDAASGGTQIGADSVAAAISVTNGYFAALVNSGGEFGAGAFAGEERWLEIAVQCSGDPAPVTLSPRQQLSAAPYALYALSVGPHDHWGQSWSGSGTGLTLSGGDTGFSGSGTAYGVSGQATSTSGRGIYGYASAVGGVNYGVYGESASTGGGTGVFGIAPAVGVSGRSTATSGITSGVTGWADSTEGIGVWGTAAATSGTTSGVYGLSNSPEGRGVYGRGSYMGISGLASDTAGTNYGVYGRSNSPDGRGVAGYAGAVTGSAYGVTGVSDADAGRGVNGYATATSGTTYGVYGQSNSSQGYGVYGYTSSTTPGAVTYGVYGKSDADQGVGVYAEGGNSGRGVVARAGTGFPLSRAVDAQGGYQAVSGSTDCTASGCAGVRGAAVGTSGDVFGLYGVCGSSPACRAGYFEGDVQVTGDFSASGTKSFKIDHPLDPANRYLYHYSVESSEVLNQYSGNIVLDAKGEAWVELPAWFAAINKDYRYQLTPIGASAPTLYIAQEIEDGRFQIAGGSAGLKVSWQVTALRDDPYLRQHGAPVEVDKRAVEQGTYLHPELYGQPEELGWDYQLNHPSPKHDGPGVASPVAQPE